MCGLFFLHSFGSNVTHTHCPCFFPDLPAEMASSGQKIFSRVLPSSVKECIDLDNELDPDSTNQADFQTPQTLSGDSCQFKTVLKSTLKRKVIDLNDKERRREREARRRKLDSVKLAHAARQHLPHVRSRRRIAERKRKQQDSVKSADAARQHLPHVRFRRRIAERKRKQQDSVKVADRVAKKKPIYKERNSLRIQSVRLNEKERTLKSRIQFAKANRLSNGCEKEDTWASAAARISVADGSEVLQSMPPCYCALNDTVCLQAVGDMYGFLHKLTWCTCVVCWRAWFSIPSDFRFSESLRPGSASLRANAKWFDPLSSVTLRSAQKKRVNHWIIEFDDGQDIAARQYLLFNFSAENAQQLLSTLVDTSAGRDICICRSCSVHVKDNKLQPRSGARLCDYAVDPVRWWAVKEDGSILMHERYSL